MAAALSLLPAMSATEPLWAANDTLFIPNAADVKWAIHGDRVYFRNLDEFDAGWLGCCYNYYVDLNTDSGKAMFSAFLSKHMAAQALKIYVDEKGVKSPILMIGNWD